MSSLKETSAARASGVVRGAGTELGGFKKFLLRGNVVDLAVGIVIGAAFGNIVQALVKDVITPLIGGGRRRRPGPCPLRDAISCSATSSTRSSRSC